MDNCLFVIGDSNVRGFSMFTNVIPIMAGAGATLNFTTEKSTKITFNKIASLAQNLPSQAAILFSINTDHRIIFRGGSLNKKNEIKYIAKRYIETINNLQIKYNFNPIVLAPCPNYSVGINEEALALWNIYLDYLIEFAAEFKISFADIRGLGPYSKIAKYSYDNIHYSDWLVREILENSISEIIKGFDFEQMTSWKHTHLIETVGAKVIGNFNPNELLVKENHSLNLQKFEIRNTNAKRTIQNLIKRIKNHSSVISICGSEGFTNVGFRKHLTQTYFFDKFNYKRAEMLKIANGGDYSLEYSEVDVWKAPLHNFTLIWEDCDSISKNAFLKLFPKFNDFQEMYFLNCNTSTVSQIISVIESKNVSRRFGFAAIEDGLFELTDDQRSKAGGLKRFFKF